MCKFVAVLEGIVHICNKYIISENIIYENYLYMHMHCGLKYHTYYQRRFSQALLYYLPSVLYVTFMLDNQDFVFPTRVFIHSQWQDGTNSEISLQRKNIMHGLCIKTLLLSMTSKPCQDGTYWRGNTSIWSHFPVLRIRPQVILWSPGLF